MLKKIFLCSLLSANLFASDNDKPKNSSTSTTMIVIYCVGGVVVIAGGVLAAPLVLPASTVLAIQTSAAAAGTSVANAFIVATPYAQGVSFGVSAGRAARPYIIQTIDEQLVELLKAEAAELFKEKNNLIKCFIKNKADTQKDSLGCPTACEDIADTFAILAGRDEFDKVMKSMQ